MSNSESSTKVCSKCGVSKPKSEFNKRINRPIGITSSCKSCVKIAKLEYRRTEKGVFADIYNKQKERSRDRGHQPPNYTKQQLSIWIKSQPNFQELWDNWVKSGYKKMLKPSCDRADDYRGYCLTRLRLMSWGAHNKKSYLDRKNGVNRKGTVAVIGINIITKNTVKFYSISEANRKLNISISNIASCCRGNRKSAGGYTWEYIA